jgi:hypothetical protein
MRHFFRTASDADCGGALDLRDLAGSRPHAAGRSGDQNGVAVAQPSDVQQPEIGGQPGQAQHAEIGGRCQWAGDHDLVGVLAVGDGMFLHAEGSVDPVAGRKLWVVRGDDAAYRQRPHHLTDLDRRDIGTGRAHPAAHGGIDRDVSRLDDELVFGWLGNRRRDQLEIRVLDLALRASRKSELPAPAHRAP